MTESPQVNGRQLRHSRKETKDGRTTNRVAASCHTRTSRRVPANRMQPCRGIAWWAHRDDVAGRGSSPFALCPKPYRIGRPLCLENPRPEGAEYSLTESAPSPFHAEPEH